MGWYFEPFPQMGGASAGAFRNTLAGVGVPSTHLFVREVIQNSVDASRSSHGKVHVKIRERTLRDSQLKDLRKHLHLTSDSDLLRRSELLQGGDIQALLSNEMSVLYVEDHGTVGLGGTDGALPADPTDNYRRLCLELGVTVQGRGRGGTFGYGKAAYWAVSDLWTVVFYSRFEPTKRSAGASSRLIAVSWFNEHTHAEEGPETALRFTGRAWFGGSQSGYGCLPFVDEEADEIAEKLGFASRTASDTGTSAMILCHALDTSELSEAVEENWWPRLLQDRLVIELPDGTVPSPRSNKALRPFIRCWDLVEERDLASEDETHKILAYKGESLGALAATTDPDDQTEPSRYRVALVRGPGMVVRVIEGKASTSSQPNAVGVFLADGAMDAALAASEPPAHDRWDHNTTRSDRNLTVSDRRKIDQIQKKIRSELRNFLRLHQEPPPKPPERCASLERLLGSFMSFKKDTTSRPPLPSPDIFSLRFKDKTTREIELADGEARISAVLALSATDDAFEDGEDEIVVRVRSWVDLLIDRSRTTPRSERLKMAYMRADDPKDGDAVPGSEGDGCTEVEIMMCPDEGIWEIELLSEPLPHPEYAARLVVGVERIS